MSIRRPSWLYGSAQQRLHPTKLPSSRHRKAQVGKSRRLLSPDWLNAVAAIGTLAIGIATLWTTAQISGIEDYLRSEIGRRNSDLNALSDRTRRLAAVAEDRSSLLEKLRSSTDRVMASSIAAQGNLITTTQDLNHLNIKVRDAQAQVAAASDRLLDMDKISAGQRLVIDGLRRERLYGEEIMQLTFNVFVGDDEVTGERAYQSIISPRNADVTADPLLDDYRRRAAGTCIGLRTINPRIPPAVPYPKAPSPPGRREQNVNDVSYWMTPLQRKNWDDAQATWSSAYSDASLRNADIAKAEAVTREKIMNLAHVCMCQAIVTTENPKGKICR